MSVGCTTTGSMSVAPSNWSLAGWGGSRGVQVVCARGTYLIIKVGVNVFGRDVFFVKSSKKGDLPPGATHWVIFG